MVANLLLRLYDIIVECRIYTFLEREFVCVIYMLSRHSNLILDAEIEDNV